MPVNAGMAERLRLKLDASFRWHDTRGKYMDFREFYLTTGRNILLLIGQIIIIAACIAYIEFIYYGNILPDKVVSETYTQTECLVSDERIATHGKVVHHYRADFLITYMANGVKHSRWVSGNGLDESFTTNRSSQEDVLSGYTVGQSYPCWYNPNAPEVAVLVLRHSWVSTFPLFIPSVVLLIVIYYLWRNVYELIGRMSARPKQ